MTNGRSPGLTMPRRRASRSSAAGRRSVGAAGEQPLVLLLAAAQVGAPLAGLALGETYERAGPA